MKVIQIAGKTRANTPIYLNSSIICELHWLLNYIPTVLLIWIYSTTFWDLVEVCSATPDSESASTTALKPGCKCLFTLVHDKIRMIVWFYHNFLLVSRNWPYIWLCCILGSLWYEFYSQFSNLNSHFLHKSFPYLIGWALNVHVHAPNSGRLSWY